MRHFTLIISPSCGSSRIARGVAHVSALDYVTLIEIWEKTASVIEAVNKCNMIHGFNSRTLTAQQASRK